VPCPSPLCRFCKTRSRALLPAALLLDVALLLDQGALALEQRTRPRTITTSWRCSWAAPFGTSWLGARPAVWAPSRLLTCRASRPLHPNDVEIGVAGDVDMLRETAALGPVTAHSAYLK
jgi:hypothetical protein